MKRLISLALCSVLVFTLCPPAFAAGDTMTWTGGGANDYWNTADNWDLAQVPNVGDTAVIPESQTAGVSANTNVTLDCSGEVLVEAGANLTLAGTSHLRGGRLGARGGGTPGKITVANGGTLQWSGGSIEGNGTFTIDANAQLVIAADSDVNLSRPLINNGQIMINTGTLSLTGGSGPIFAGSGGTGTLTVSDGAYLDLVQGAYSIGGEFVNGGSLSIWETSSALFKASYRQEVAGALSLKFWGLSSFSELNVTGEAALGGVLEVDLIGDYVPEPGNTFEVVTCGSRTGTFSSIISNMPEITFEPIYTDTGVTLTVAAADGNVCKIGSTGYPTLDNALAVVQDGETIELLKDIDYTNDSSDSAILNNGKNITFDLGGYALNINNSEGEGVNLVNEAEMSFTGGGELNISSRGLGLYVGNSSFESDNSVPVTIVSSNGAGVDANESTVQILNGSASGNSFGIYAYNDCTITVNGPVSSSNSHAVFLEGSGNTVNVGSAVVMGGTMGHGVRVDAGGSVTVGSLSSPGRVIGRNGGVYTIGNIDKRTYVTVYGDVEGVSYGICAFDNAEMKVHGNVRSTSTTSSTYGVSCFSDSGSPSSLIEVEGDVAGPSGLEVVGAASRVNVTGHVTANGSGPYQCGVYADGGVAEVGGNVNAAGCIGAVVSGNGQITVDGSIAAAKYVVVAMGTEETEKTIDDRTLQTTKEGYHTYQGGTATVWVKDEGAPAVPGAPQNFTATPSNRRVDLSWTAPASDGGAAIIRYEVSGNNGAIWLTASSSTAHAFIGLYNGQTYSFKVRAISSAGNGAEASATATPRTVPTAPLNCTTAPGDGQVVLSWTAPLTDGGSDITSYQVSGDGGAIWTDVGLGTSHTFTGLTNGTAYTFIVRAVNGAGDGAAESATATPMAAPAGPGVTPASLDITTGSTGTFTVSLGESGNEAASATATSADTTIVTVDPADITTSGQAVSVTAVSAGNTTVTISYSGGSYTGGDQTVSISVTDPVPATHAVNFYSHGSLYASRIAASGSALGANWPDNPTRSQYSFSGWFTGQDGAGTRYTDSTIILTDADLHAKWTYNGGGFSDDSDDVSNGGSSAPTAPTYAAVIKAGNGAETTLPVTVDQQAGTAIISADSQSLTQGGTMVTIPSIPDVNTYLAGIPVPDLSTTETQHTLTLNTDMGSIIVPSNMLTGVAEVNGDEAQISIGQGDKGVLPDDVKDAIGDRPLVRLMLCIDGKQINWHNPEAPVSVAIPYTPTAAELADPEGIVVWYIDGDGNPISVPNGHYDPEAGTVTFTTTHFSYYAVSHNHVSFVDVANDAWYARAVSFIAAREISMGAEGDSFNPEAKLTRGESLVMLMKAYGIAPDLNPQDNFADAEGAPCAGYLAAAKRLDISGGVGNNLFAPDREITRQELFTLLHNTLKAIGKLPRGSSEKTLSNFSDISDVASWAKDAITLLVETGIISVSGSRLSPMDTTTKAQMAQMLYSLLPE